MANKEFISDLFCFIWLNKMNKSIDKKKNKQLRMCLRRAGRDWRALLHLREADPSFSLTRYQHSTFETTSCPPFWNYDVKSKIRLRQSMCINIHLVCAPRSQCTALQTDRQTVRQTDVIMMPRANQAACSMIGYKRCTHSSQIFNQYCMLQCYSYIHEQ